ncbi:MAG: dTDP-4-dehydrorhamnose 3,5-epimerase [Elusimicrobia bacterium]|nr:dTDP-4-dehydrorhamnose 3,5-epimerase [Elusimicrobiota bacterium]
MALTLTPYGGLDGLLLVEGPFFADDRGFFFESFRADEWEKAGLPRLVQDNFSRSRRGVVRGLHYQVPPRPVGKLVRCTRGRVFDVAVDLRRRSPTYGRHAAVELDDAGNRMFWVPPGFAHGFCALAETADVAYKVSGVWSADVDRGIRWNDPALAIPWPVRPAEAVLTAKDAALPLLADADNPF